MSQVPWEFPDIDLLDDEDEAMLRKIVDMQKAGERQNDFYILGYPVNSREGKSINRLGKAKMVCAGTGDGCWIAQDVYPAGLSYIRKIDEAAEAERRRQEERKEDKRHDWKISVFTALVGIAGALGGTILGYWLGAARPFL